MSTPILFGPAGAINLQDSLVFSKGAGPTVLAPGTPVDPTATAVSAAPGSLYLNKLTGYTYRKLDSGSTTNWQVVGGVSTIVTNWSNSLTFAPCAGFGTTTLYDVRWRRVGDSMQIMGSFKAGTTSAIVATISMPVGYTIDGSKLTGNQLAKQGIWVAGGNSGGAAYVANAIGPAFYDGSDTSNIYLAYRAQGGGYMEKANVNTILGTNDTLSFDITVPISGWDAQDAGATNALGFNFSNWMAYTPTVSGFGSSTLATTAFWRRVGDTLEVQGHIDITTFSTFSGPQSITIPSGLLIDNSKGIANVANQQPLGLVTIRTSSIATNTPQIGQVLYSSTNSVELRMSVLNTGYNPTLLFDAVQIQDYQALVSGDSVAFQFSVPIQGWSASAFSSGNVRTVTSATDTMTLNDVAGTILVNRAGAVSITLPSHTAGARYTIKDISGAAATNNITIARFGGTGNFENVAANYVMNQNLQSIEILDDGTNYWIVGDADVSTGGGGSGITRSVASISTPTTLGAAALTDYVALVSGTTTVTMPTAVGNTNRYSVKNAGSNTVTVAFTGGQTGDGSSTLTLTPNSAVDLVSDNSNWRVI